MSFAFAADGSEVGLVAGDDGVLLTTRDGGEHWQATTQGSRATLRGTAISEDALLLLAVGDDGGVLRSSDGGVSFEALRIEGAGALYDVALDAAGRTALAVDDAGGVYRSLDGAQSFEREANETSRITENGSVDTYRVGKSVRKRGFDPAALEDPAALAARVNEILASFSGAITIEREGDTLTDRRYWVAELPQGTVRIPCGGTHVESVAELGTVTVTLETEQLEGAIGLTMTTTAQPG